MFHLKNHQSCVTVAIISKQVFSFFLCVLSTQKLRTVSEFAAFPRDSTQNPQKRGTLKTPTVRTVPTFRNRSFPCAVASPAAPSPPSLLKQSAGLAGSGPTSSGRNRAGLWSAAAPTPAGCFSPGKEGGRGITSPPRRWGAARDGASLYSPPGRCGQRAVPPPHHPPGLLAARG